MTCGFAVAVWHCANRTWAKCGDQRRVLCSLSYREGTGNRQPRGGVRDDGQVSEVSVRLAEPDHQLVMSRALFVAEAAQLVLGQECHGVVLLEAGCQREKLGVMKVFDEAIRTETRPYGDVEPAFQFLNRVCDNYWDQVREVIKRWFSRFQADA